MHKYPFSWELIFQPLKIELETREQSSRKQNWGSVERLFSSKPTLFWQRSECCSDEDVSIFQRNFLDWLISQITWVNYLTCTLAMKKISFQTHLRKVFEKNLHWFCQTVSSRISVPVTHNHKEKEECGKETNLNNCSERFYFLLALRACLFKLLHLKNSCLLSNISCACELI